MYILLAAPSLNCPSSISCVSQLLSLISRSSFKSKSISINGACKLMRLLKRKKPFWKKMESYKKSLIYEVVTGKRRV